MYRASVGVTTSMNLSVTNWIGKNANALGIEGIWVGEDIDVGQETTVIVADLLTKAVGVRVGTGIIPIAVHNVSTIARAALTLHEIGAGRYILGVGLGGVQDLLKRNIHVKKPVSALRDVTEALRQLYHGEKVSKATELFSLQDFCLHVSEPVNIPIFFGVRGPQMLKLAGEIADGVILSGPTEYIRYAINLVDKTAEKVGREKNSIEKVVWSPTIPTFEGGNEKLAKSVVALVVADTPRQVLDLLDINIERATKICEAVASSGPKVAAEFVNDKFLETFAISGSKEQIVDRFEQLHTLGATEVVLGPPFSGNWRDAMEQIFQEIHSRREI